ncbi:hypothetical protein [Streptomyces prunicolor]
MNNKGLFGQGFAGIIPVRNRSYGDDLWIWHRCGRPIVVGVFHEVFIEAELWVELRAELHVPHAS